MASFADCLRTSPKIYHLAVARRKASAELHHSKFYLKGKQNRGLPPIISKNDLACWAVQVP